MMERAELLEYWRSPAPHGNAPADFIPPVRRSEVLAELIADVPRDARILEIGCNVGRNLAYLTDLGYERLEGLEISTYAVALMRGTYRQLGNVSVYMGPVEDLLPQFRHSYDLIFTMAVLEHVHPDVILIVASAIASLTNDLLVIEPSAGREHFSDRQHPHDLHALFTQYGLLLVSQEELEDRSPVDFTGYAAWRFRRLTESK